MPRTAAALVRLASDQSGVAAVELAITLPFLLLLFFGVVNVADYVSSLNRLSRATALVGDLVARNDATVSSADIDDYFTAARLSLGIKAPQGLRIEVQAIRKSGGALASVPEWSRSWGDKKCQPPDTASLAAVVADGHDIIIALSCKDYEPPVASFLGNDLLGFASTTLQRQVVLIPRMSATLSCNDC